MGNVSKGRKGQERGLGEDSRELRLDYWEQEACTGQNHARWADIPANSISHLSSCPETSVAEPILGVLTRGCGRIALLYSQARTSFVCFPKILYLIHGGLAKHGIMAFEANGCNLFNDIKTVISKSLKIFKNQCIALV